MSLPNAQHAGPSDGLGPRSSRGDLENVVRGMILGHDSLQIESGAPEPTSRHQQRPASHVPMSDTNDAPTPNRQHMLGTRQSQDRARSMARAEDHQSSSSGQKPQPQKANDAGATTHGNAPVQYNMKQARQPRRRQATRLNQASATNSGPAAATAGLSNVGISNATPQSEQQPSSQRRRTPAAASNSHARPQNQPRLPHGSQPRHLQPPQPSNPQQGIQRAAPPSSSYGRPPPQHQRLYDPHAASQQYYHDPTLWGRLSSKAQHLLVQGQINYLDATAEIQVPKVTISSEEEEQKEGLRRVLEDVCQKAITEYEVAKEPLFDGSTVSLKCFGSLRTGFATRSSDMDLALESPQSVPDAALPESDIPRVLEKALLDLGYGARLLTRTRVPIIRFCEKPTPELAVRLREERLKWEKGRDASPKVKKHRNSKPVVTSEQHSKESGTEKKGKDAKGKPIDAKSSATHCRGDQLKSRAESGTVSSSGQATEAENIPTKHSATESASAQEFDEKMDPRNELGEQDGNVTTGDQGYSAENSVKHVDSTSRSVADFVNSETEAAHDLDVSRDTDASRDTHPTAMVATGLMRLSMADNADFPERNLDQAKVNAGPQALQSESPETVTTGKVVGQAAEPQPRLESTLPDEEIVRLYRLAMKEGWFEPVERGIIFAFIKAFEDTSSQDQLTAYRSQLLTLPDVLNRYRPPPEHHLDFPKDGVGMQCDINFSNRLALHNSQMLRCYNLSDPRVRPMVLFVKSWAKRRKINSPYHGTLSSYGYVLMVLHYLVNVARPPICLNLQTVEMAGRDISPENTRIVDGYSVRFWRDEKEIQQWSQNRLITADHHSSVGSLLRGFFRYFAVVSGGFSWGTDVLSLRTPGGILSKKQKDWIAAKTVVLESAGEGQKGQEVRQRYLFAIEDPFEINHNIARTVVHNGIVAIRDEFRRANKLIYEAGDGRTTEDLFEEAEAKDDLNYRHFGPRPRPPQQTIAAAAASRIADSEGKQCLNRTATNVKQPTTASKPRETIEHDSQSRGVEGRMGKTQLEGGV